MTTDYTNRQIDLELLQSIVVPSPDRQRVSVSTLSSQPKVVTGIEKAIQRYTQLLLTTTGDIHFGQDVGGSFMRSIMQGSVGDKGALTHLFCITSANALKVMALDDQDVRFGTVSTDERLVDATLLDLDMDYSNFTISISVQLTTAAGNQYQFVVPVSTAG